MSLSSEEMFFYNSFLEQEDFTQVLQLDIASVVTHFQNNEWIVSKQWMDKEIVIKLKEKKNKDRNKIGNEKKIVFKKLIWIFLAI